MAKKIKWNDRALDTFHDIAVYLEEEYSTKTSEKFVQKVLAKLKRFKSILQLVGKHPKEKVSGLF